MGNTTLVEFNHDRFDEIEKDPSLLGLAILEQMRGASLTGCTIPGGRVIAFFNRSGGEADRDWEAYVKKHGSRTDYLTARQARFGPR